MIQLPHFLVLIVSTSGSGYRKKFNLLDGNAYAEKKEKEITTASDDGNTMERLNTNRIFYKRKWKTKKIKSLVKKS